MLNEIRTGFFFILGLFTDNNVYIQGSDADIEGVWRFSDGQLMKYLHWYSSGEHDREPLDYVIMSKSRSYGWENVDGSRAYSFICEKYTHIPPEP